MIEAFFLAISPSYLMYMTIGVLLGLVVGTLPGLTIPSHPNQQNYKTNH
jgi:TctA family transporter